VRNEKAERKRRKGKSHVSRVNLGIKLCIANQVHNPLLGLLTFHVQLLCKAGQVNALVDLAVGLKDQVPGVVEKQLKDALKEEVVLHHLLALAQGLLGAIKVKVDVEGLHELGQRVTVVVRLLLDEGNNVLHRLTATALAQDRRDSEVSQDVRAGSLDGLPVGGLQQDLEQQVTSILVVEEDEQTPVNDPSSLLEQLNRGGDALLIIDEEKRRRLKERKKEKNKKKKKKHKEKNRDNQTLCSTRARRAL